MTPANGILRFAQNVQPSLMAPALAGTDALKVNVFDGLVDLRVSRGLRAGAKGDGIAGVGLVVRVAEAEAPVREVRADDECVGWVCKVGGEDFA